MTFGGSPTSSISVLAAQFVRTLASRARRVLVVKALPDEQFAEVLSAIQQALPEVSITSIVSGGEAGPAHEVGEVLHTGTGLRALWRGLRAGFDVCVIAVDPEAAGGWRGLAADSVAWLSKAKEKVFCSQAGIFRHSGPLSVFFAPLFSGIRFIVSFVVTVLWAILATLMLATGVIIGELGWRVLRFLRLVSVTEETADRIALVQACTDHGLQRAARFLRMRHPGAEIQTIPPPARVVASLLPREQIGRPGLLAVAVDESSGDYLAGAILALRLRGRKKVVCLADEGAELLPLGWGYVIRLLFWRIAEWLGERACGLVGFLRRFGPTQAEDLVLHRITLRAHPSDMKDPQVLIVTEGEGVSQRYRCEHKAEQLRLMGRPVRLRWASEYQSCLASLTADAAWADMVILHRVPPTGAIRRLLDQCERSGRPTVFDIDDWIFDREARSFMSWNRPDSLEDYIAANSALLDRCSHSIGATTPLVERLQARGKPAFLLINNVGLEWLRLSERGRRFRQEQEGATLAYVSGTPTHDKDFAQILPALTRVMRAMPSVRLRIAGPLNIPEEMSHFQDRIEHIGFVPWRKIPYILGDVDMNLAPLEIGNPFAESKSELKYLEASPLGLPTIASPTPAFRKAITRGENGLLAESEKEWAEALLECIEEPTRRRKLGENARRHVEEVYHPRVAAERLVGVIDEILSRRASPEKTRHLPSPENLRSQ